VASIGRSAWHRLRERRDDAGGAAAVCRPWFQTVVVADQPDGRNINLDCGSTHPERLGRLVVERECQMGVRSTATAIARSSSITRAVVNGDAVLLMCGRQLQREGRLRGNAVLPPS